MSQQLPTVNFSQIVGVLEIVDDFKGHVDVARIAGEYGLDIDELLPSVEAGELLGFVKVTDGDIVLQDPGRKVLKASLRQRKLLLREAVLRTPIFQDVIAKLRKSGGAMDREALAEILGFKLWTHDMEKAARTVINWGRHTGILSYDADTHQVRLLDGQGT
jgi:NitT/TauT family transport system ATP-binding protein